MYAIPLVGRVLCCATVGAVCWLAACAPLPGGDLDGGLERAFTASGADRPPLYRGSGPRLPAFSGGDPGARGWVKVDGLLWIEQRDEPSYRAGLVFDGVSYVPVDAAPACGVSAERGFRLRTDHLAVHTNATWNRALEVAREAETHIGKLLGAYGDPLDLRLPEGPLKVVVAATRGEFERTLGCLVQDPVGWGAFYDARSSNVYVCLEPAPHGPLPWRSDLRHELTHQVLDLSRPPSRRARPFASPWFWLWEGFAVWTERLGDDSAADALAPRLERFRRKAAWGTSRPLASFFALDQASFRGEDYDQAASWMRFLLDPGVPDRRRAVLEAVRALLAGAAPDGGLEGVLGGDTAEVERDWRAAIAR